MKTLIISGMSGSGKSLAYKTFEDIGFYCMDNVPVEMLPHYQTYFEKHQNQFDKVALVVDGRDTKSIKMLPTQINTWKEKDQGIEVLFFDAHDPVLINRYSETRHRHPLSPKGSIEEGIAKERELLAPVRAIANYYIDTSEFSSRDLRAHIAKRFGDIKEGAHGLGITVMSFGFKYGIPLNSDLLLDVRFLANPFFEKNLKYKTGLDSEVQKFVFDQEGAIDFVDRIIHLLHFLLPRYEKEGKSYLQLSIGCTGGQHRSVAMVEKIAQILIQEGLDVHVVHREQED
ncbi:MAG: RNase adapter RapZ [Bdellovibrionales bacterium]|nr:RNase adapter RapZ [Bdellovibrionales bacterium]